MASVKGFYFIRKYTGSSTSWGECLTFTGTGGFTLAGGNNSSDNDHVTMLWNISGDYYHLISATKGTDGSSFTWLFQQKKYFNVLHQTATDNYVPYFGLQEVSTTLSDTLDVFQMEKTGTTTINGATLDVVRFKHKVTGYYLSWQLWNENKSKNPYVTLRSFDYDSLYTLFTIQSTTPYDPALTVPSDLRQCKKQYDKTTYLKDVDWNTEKGYVYPKWSAPSWMGNSDYSFFYRIGTKTEDNSNKWSNSYSYSDWVEGNLSCRDGYTSYWPKNSITIPKTSTSIKAVKSRLEVYASKTIDSQKFVSQTSAKEITLARRPSVMLEGASWTPQGLALNFISDYFNQGSHTIIFEKIYKIHDEDVDIIDNVLKKNYTMKNIYKDETYTIPTEYFTRALDDGDEIEIHGYVQSDVYAPTNNEFFQNGKVKFNTGSVDVTPTVTELSGLWYQADVAYSNTVRMWLVCDGQTEELTGTISNGHTIFKFIPPFCKEYYLFTSYNNTSTGAWGVARTEMQILKLRAHCFWWDTGSVILWLNKNDPLNEKFSFKTQSETHTLSGRSHDYISYLTNGKKNYVSVTGDITGYVVPFLKTYGTTKESIEALVEVGHARYRSPYGRVCNVAVTDASITTELGISEVTLSIVQEDV